jgi:CspA family cold shock protein
MSVGVVKWFNNAKGFGFIISEDGNEDLFAHYSAITMDGYKTLKAGQPVTFDVTKGEKGLHAINIVAVPNPELSEASATEASQDIPTE